MNQPSFQDIQATLSTVSRWLFPLLVLWLLGAAGLGWIVKSFFILLGLILITPIIVVLGLRWWVKRNLIQSQCPVCQYQFVGINGGELNCPSCHEPLKMEQGQFQRLTPPGTIDVQAVEVNAQVVDD